MFVIFTIISSVAFFEVFTHNFVTNYSYSVHSCVEICTATILKINHMFKLRLDVFGISIKSCVNGYKPCPCDVLAFCVVAAVHLSHLYISI